MPKKEKNIRVRPLGITLLGIIMFIFTVFGIVVSVFLAANLTSSIINQTERKQTFARLITPLAMQDPPPVEEIGKLENSTLLLAGIWDIVFTEDKSKYETDGYNISVPATDVEVHLKKMFGFLPAITHAGISTTDIIIDYSPAEAEGTLGNYILPEGISYSGYTPRIKTIEKMSGEYLLTVDYIYGTSVWQTFKSGKDTEVAKTMVYVLENTNKDGYVVKRIRRRPVVQVQNSVPQTQSNASAQEIKPDTESEEPTDSEFKG